jgi:hypothetical protein
LADYNHAKQKKTTCMSALDDCCAASHTEADTPHDFKARYLLNIQQKWRQNQ